MERLASAKVTMGAEETEAAQEAEDIEEKVHRQSHTATPNEP